MAGHKTFANLEELDEAEINGYLMGQAVMRFADSTERGAELGAPSLGMVSFLEDAEAYEWYDGAAWVPLIPVPLVYATAGRPAATAVPVGESYFDSTLGVPVWSNGTDWVDATGATV